jgi:hypothetical protein
MNECLAKNLVFRNFKFSIVLRDKMFGIGVE